MTTTQVSLKHQHVCSHGSDAAGSCFSQQLLICNLLCPPPSFLQLRAPLLPQYKIPTCLHSQSLHSLWLSIGHSHLRQAGPVQHRPQAPSILIAHIVQHQTLTRIEANADVPLRPANLQQHNTHDTSSTNPLDSSTDCYCQGHPYAAAATSSKGWTCTTSGDPSSVSYFTPC